jgi:two-component sensor histidine kinase
MTLLRRSLILVLICLAPVVLAEVVNTWDLRHSRRSEIQAGAVQQVVSISSDLNQLFEGFRQLLITLSLTPAVRRQGDSCPALLATVVKNNDLLTNIGVSDLDGTVVCAAGSGPGAVAMSSPPFSAMRETDAFAVGDYRPITAGAPPTVSMAVPISGGAGETVGLIWATVTPEGLTKHLRTRALSPNTLVVVSDRNGTIIASAPDESFVGRQVPAELAQLIGSKMMGTTTAVGPDGVPRVFGYVPVSLRPDGQFVAVGIDLAASFEQLDLATWRAVMLIGIGVALGLLAAVVGSRQFLQRPVRRLVEVTRRWREGDLTARADLRPGTSEIAILGDAFDTMAAALASRTAELVEAKQRAEQRAAEAEAAERQKTVLLKEVNHRVKNSLQLVSSLLNLQANAVREDDVRHHFAAAAARVQTIARVHARLFQTDDVHTVEFGRYLKDLCADLEQSFSQSARPHFHIDVVRLQLATDRVIPLALIVNELLTNVFKYAYPAGEEAHVRVESRQSGDALLVEVSDEGAGLPADFDPQRSGGLGMRLILALVTQLDARLDIARLSKGTRFTITVPLGSGADPDAAPESEAAPEAGTVAAC